MARHWVIMFITYAYPHLNRGSSPFFDPHDAAMAALPAAPPALTMTCGREDPEISTGRKLVRAFNGVVLHTKYFVLTSHSQWR